MQQLTILMYSLVVPLDFHTLLILLSKCGKTREAKEQGRPGRHLVEISSAVLELPLVYYKRKSSFCLIILKTVQCTIYAKCAGQ